MPRIIGFYTDEEGRKRPITASSGHTKMKLAVPKVSETLEPAKETPDDKRIKALVDSFNKKIEFFEHVWDAPTLSANIYEAAEEKGFDPVTEKFLSKKFDVDEKIAKRFLRKIHEGTWSSDEVGLAFLYAPGSKKFYYIVQKYDPEKDAYEIITKRMTVQEVLEKINRL